MAALGLADLHIHTSYSDGWPSPAAVVRYAAERTDLDVIAVTDHDTIEGALRAAEVAGGLRRPHVIVGEEVSSLDGHIVGLFLQRCVPPGLSAAATVSAIHEQGGLAFAAHPFWRTERASGGRRRVHGVGWLAGDLELDGIEIENSTPGFYVFNQMAARLNETAGLAALGNSDAHILDAIGRARTAFPGRTPEALRRAVGSRRTRALRERYRPLGLVRYVAWGLSHQRQRALAPVTT